MNNVDWEKVKDVFSSVIDEPTETRDELLRQKCNGDEALYAEVRSLIDASSEPVNLIESNAIDLAVKIDLPETDYSDRHFGNYLIIREIGSGGMGTVFLAERDDGEFSMQVALKIVRQSIADKEVIARFKRERQILAELKHPNIAALYDGGVSDNGEPYLAMEYVDGKSLTDYATESKLNVRERLVLFLKICSAVDFAHRNLVVHRDIKPANILITKDGEPKLLDFGLARSFESDSPDTRTALRAFTPAYASPEQILGKPLTTSTDVYSLGVVFYEFISGQKPFKLDGLAYEQLVQTLSNFAPAAPSKVSHDYEKATGKQNDLKGDLDNIALMAIRKEPERRYASVAAFADDIRAHLDGRPISARPNTFGYLASSFVRRNRVAVGSAILIILAVFTGLGVALWQANVARRESARSKAVNQFLQIMLLTAIPGSGGSGKKGAQATIVDVLKEAEKRLDGEELSSQNEIRATLRQLIGEAYLAQGIYDDAGRNLTMALDELSTLFGRDSPQTLKAEYSLARLYQEKGDYNGAYEMYDRRFVSWQSEFNRRQIEPELYLRKLSEFASACRARGDSERAEQLLREALDVATRFSIDSQVDLARSVLALILLDQGRFEEAQVAQTTTVGRIRGAGSEDEPSLPLALTLMGSILMEKGDLAAAETNLFEGEARYHKLFGPEYLPLFDNIRIQAQADYLKGDYQSAERKVDLALDNYRKNSSPKNISYATALTIKGLILNKLNRREEAEKILREALQLRRDNLPPGHFLTALTEGAFGEVLTDAKKYVEAGTLLRQSLSNLETSQKAENLRLATARSRLARLEAARSGQP